MGRVIRYLLNGHEPDLPIRDVFQRIVARQDDDDSRRGHHLTQAGKPYERPVEQQPSHVAWFRKA